MATKKTITQSRQQSLTGRVVSLDAIRGFKAGCASAGELLTTAGNVKDGSAFLKPEYRTGYQNNFAYPFIQRVIEHPEEAEGFAAALSDFLAGVLGDGVWHTDHAWLLEADGWAAGRMTDDGDAAEESRGN